MAPRLVVPPPPSLDEEGVARLQELVEATARHNRREGAQAAEQALKLVPWPLRGTVRKVAGV